MVSKIYDSSLFAKLFSIGLLLLFIDVFKEPFYTLTNTNFAVLNAIPIFAIGAVLCLISVLFLLIEWMTLPFGTKTKRIKLYQGMGNLFAFAMLASAWIFKGQSAQNQVNSSSIIFALSGLVVALLFGWAGKNIADLISRKKIRFEPIS